MPWIETHQKLERHPKTLGLATLMGWGLDETLGKLLRFWWWSVDYAEDGDLRRYNAYHVANAMGVVGDQAEKLIMALCDCGGQVGSEEFPGFLDREPYLRIHDWWDTIGPWLRKKYRYEPDKWKRVEKLYSKPSGLPKVPESHANQTKPNQTITKPTDLLLPGLRPPLVVGPGGEGKVNEEERKGSPASAVGADLSDQGPGRGVATPPNLNPEELLELWNASVPATMPQVREKTKSRLRKAGLRLAEHPERAWWEEIFARIKASKFLQGDGSTGWVCTIDFLLDNDKNAVKIMEGKYDDRKTGRNAGAAAPEPGKYQHLKAPAAVPKVRPPEKIV